MHEAIRRWVRLAVLAGAAVAHAQEAGAVETTNAAEVKSEARANALILRLSGGTGLGSPGLGGVGLGGASIGLEGEHRFGRLGVSLGVNTSASRSVGDAFPLSTGLSIALEPGVRWHLAQAPGLWLGAVLPVGYAAFSAAGSDAHAYTIGAAALAGWSHTFDSGLVVQLSAGPVAQLSISELNTGAVSSSRSSSFFLRTGVGVGWAF